MIKELENVHITPLRKKNSYRQHDSGFKIWIKMVRQRVETSFSQISTFLTKSIDAVISKGFELKILLFVVAFAFQCLQVTTWVFIKNAMTVICCRVL